MTSTSLQEFCYQTIKGKPSLERELFHCHFYGDLGYIYRYKKIVKEIRFIVNNRHLLSQKQFERWFRRVNRRMDLIVQNSENEKKMLGIAKELIAVIVKFKKIYGVALKVLAKTKSLVFALERLQ